MKPMRRFEDRLHIDRKRMRKGMYVLPSLFTVGNIFAGFYAITQVMQGSVVDFYRFDHAAIAIGFAVLFDGLDGRIARMTNTATDFGKELDSLADVITFGVAPAILAWMWGFRFLPAIEHEIDVINKLTSLGMVASFIFLVASASRLARFNIQLNPQPSNPGKPGKKYFVGMATPAGAGVVAAVVHFSNGEPLTNWIVAAIWLAMMISIAFLMVSTWRFYSFKDIGIGRQSFRGFIILAALVASIWFWSEIVLFIIALTYMLSGVLTRFMFNVRRSPEQPPAYTEATESQ